MGNAAPALGSAMFVIAVQNIGLVAVLISSGLLTLIASREAFEVDGFREVESPIGGPPTLVLDWKYMSDFAQDARRELYWLVKILRLGVSYMLVAILLGMLLYGLLEAAHWWSGTPYPLHDATASLPSWFSEANVQTVVQTWLIFVLLIVGPYLLFRFTAIVSDVVMAKRNPRDNKV